MNIEISGALNEKSEYQITVKAGGEDLFKLSYAKKPEMSDVDKSNLLSEVLNKLLVVEENIKLEDADIYNIIAGCISFAPERADVIKISSDENTVDDEVYKNNLQIVKDNFRVNNLFKMFKFLRTPESILMGKISDVKLHDGDFAIPNDLYWNMMNDVGRKFASCLKEIQNNKSLDSQELLFFESHDQYCDYIERNKKDGFFLLKKNITAGSSKGSYIETFITGEHGPEAVPNGRFYIKEPEERSKFAHEDIAHLAQYISNDLEEANTQEIYKVEINKLKRLGKTLAVKYLGIDGTEVKKSSNNDSTFSNGIFALKEKIGQLVQFLHFGDGDDKKAYPLIVSISNNNSIIINSLKGYSKHPSLSFCAIDAEGSQIPITKEIFADFTARLTTTAEEEIKNKILFQAKRMVLVDKSDEHVMSRRGSIVSGIIEIDGTIYYITRSALYSENPLLNKMEAEGNIQAKELRQIGGTAKKDYKDGYWGVEILKMAVEKVRESTPQSFVNLPAGTPITGLISSAVLMSLLGNNDGNSRNLMFIEQIYIGGREFNVVNIDKKSGLGMFLSDPNADFFLPFNDALFRILGKGEYNFPNKIPTNDDNVIDDKNYLPLVGIIDPKSAIYPYAFQKSIIFEKSNVLELFETIYRLEQISDEMDINQIDPGDKFTADLAGLFKFYLPNDNSGIFYKRFIERKIQLVESAKEHLKNIQFIDNNLLLRSSLIMQENKKSIDEKINSLKKTTPTLKPKKPRPPLKTNEANPTLEESWSYDAAKPQGLSYKEYSDLRKNKSEIGRLYLATETTENNLIEKPKLTSSSRIDINIDTLIASILSDEFDSDPEIKKEAEDSLKNISESMSTVNSDRIASLLQCKVDIRGQLKNKDLYEKRNYLLTREIVVRSKTITSILENLGRTIKKPNNLRQEPILKLLNELNKQYKARDKCDKIDDCLYKLDDQTKSCVKILSLLKGDHATGQNILGSAITQFKQNISLHTELEKLTDTLSKSLLAPRTPSTRPNNSNNSVARLNPGNNSQNL